MLTGILTVVAWALPPQPQWLRLLTQACLALPEYLRRAFSRFGEDSPSSWHAAGGRRSPRSTRHFGALASPDTVSNFCVGSAGQVPPQRYPQHHGLYRSMALASCSSTVWPPPCPMVKLPREFGMYHCGIQGCAFLTALHDGSHDVVSETPSIQIVEAQDGTPSVRICRRVVCGRGFWPPG